MFELDANNYKKNGICIYKNNAGDSIFCKKKDSGFVFKLRFADKRIIAEPLYIDIPIAETEGISLKYKYETSISSDMYSDIIEDARNILYRWVSMCYDLSILEAKRLGGENIKEDVDDLRKYAELQNVIDDMSN